MQTLNTITRKFFISSRNGINASIYELNKATVKNYTTRMNIIRFISICTIVWGHCQAITEGEIFTTFHLQFIQAALMQLGRSGTVMFFIISGYFISEKITSFNISSFISYRWYSLIVPWLIFLSAITIMQLFQVTTISQFTHQGVIEDLKILWNLLDGNIIHSAYWFIPVSILTAIMLIVFKNHLHKSSFGLILMAITVFYAINLHYSWIPASHTKAVFGYAFFLWIGIRLKARIRIVSTTIESLRPEFLWISLCLTFILACFEGLCLKNQGCADPFSSLRLSSILFSILFFTILLTSKKLNTVNKLKPQAYTYGIYLIHCPIIVLTMPLLISYITANGLNNNFYVVILLQAALFICVLSSSYIIVSVIKKSPLYFLVGRDKAQLNHIATPGNQLHKATKVELLPLRVDAAHFLNNKKHFDDSSSLSHFNDTILKAYAGEDPLLIDEMIFMTKSQLLESSIILESNLINNNLDAVKRTGDKIYGTAVSVGLPMLSNISQAYQHLENLTIEEVDNLCVETKREIQLLINII